ncbi:UNVERIFIED_CONTAM: hypothetical protein NCL1_12039 [Trichonephila clavipes]
MLNHGKSIAMEKKPSQTTYFHHCIVTSFNLTKLFDVMNTQVPFIKQHTAVFGGNSFSPNGTKKETAFFKMRQRHKQETKQGFQNGIKRRKTSKKQNWYHNNTNKIFFLFTSEKEHGLEKLRNENFVFEMTRLFSTRNETYLAIA